MNHSNTVSTCDFFTDSRYKYCQHYIGMWRYLKMPLQTTTCYVNIKSLFILPHYFFPLKSYLFHFLLVKIVLRQNLRSHEIYIGVQECLQETAEIFVALQFLTYF